MPEADAEHGARRAESVADSTTNCARMSRRRAPSALRIPISRVRSLTAISMMFMITIPPTTSEMATRPGSARNRIWEIFSQRAQRALRRLEREVVLLPGLELRGGSA